MNEFGLCDGVVDAATRRANGRPVERLRVRVGILHRVDPAAFQRAFQATAQGTELEGATLELVFIPTRYECHTCDGAIETSDLIEVCPGCGAYDLELTGGDELLVDEIELKRVLPAPGEPWDRHATLSSRH